MLSSWPWTIRFELSIYDGAMLKISGPIIYSLSFSIYFYIVDHESLGYTRFESSKYDGSTLRISGAHTSTISCLKLCEATEGCNVFLFSNALNKCEISIGRDELLVTENAHYVTYIRCKLFRNSKFEILIRTNLHIHYALVLLS